MTAKQILQAMINALDGEDPELFFKLFESFLGSVEQMIRDQANNAP